MGLKNGGIFFFLLNQVVLKAFSSFYLNKCEAASSPLLMKPLLPLLFFFLFLVKIFTFGFTEMSLSFQLFKGTGGGAGLVTFPIFKIQQTDLHKIFPCYVVPQPFKI